MVADSSVDVDAAASQPPKVERHVVETFDAWRSMQWMSGTAASWSLCITVWTTD